MGMNLSEVSFDEFFDDIKDYAPISGPTQSIIIYSYNNMFDKHNKIISDSICLTISFETTRGFFKKIYYSCFRKDIDKVFKEYILNEKLQKEFSVVSLLNNPEISYFDALKIGVIFINISELSEYNRGSDDDDAHISFKNGSKSEIDNYEAKELERILESEGRYDLLI